LAKLIYTTITSLDGFIADAEGKFDWAEPDEEVHSFINDLERSVRTHLLGRRMYEVMAGWETLEDERPYMKDFAEIWRSADKIVYSTDLEAVSTARTRLERTFDPGAVEQLKSSADHDLAVGGPGLAATAIRAGLVDEWRVFLTPIIVGGGKACFPDGVRVELDLAEERRFGNGWAYLRYRTRSGTWS
jgi:dihydrofolate reductase